ncbi:hypothetical protein CPB84DRAFT_1856971 [Gymnopilus junonius]|uniref:Uncharacterized protein n=1 Tax=Gymnopilus junonius TaxID=109634 RepID=A0A9P5TFR0_GYMJU|nr:hypothetical protein CPB84DRAFT_1856971 [Gymnopilus junonius]
MYGYGLQSCVLDYVWHSIYIATLQLWSLIMAYAVLHQEGLFNAQYLTPSMDC